MQTRFDQRMVPGHRNLGSTTSRIKGICRDLADMTFCPQYRGQEGRLLPNVLKTCDIASSDVIGVDLLFELSQIGGKQAGRLLPMGIISCRKCIFWPARSAMRIEGLSYLANASDLLLIRRLTTFPGGLVHVETCVRAAHRLSPSLSGSSILSPTSVPVGFTVSKVG